MSKNEYVKKTDIEALKELTEYFRKWLKEHDQTAKNLKTGKKFAGTLGEALALTKLYSDLKKIEWRGGNKKGADIVLHTKKGSDGIEIKTSTDGIKVTLFTSKIKDGKSIRKKNGESLNTKKRKIFKSIREEVYRNVAEYWMIVDVKNDKYDILDKKRLARLLVHAHEEYLNGKHKKKNYHYGITKSDSKIIHYIKLKDLREYSLTYNNFIEKVRKS